MKNEEKAKIIDRLKNLFFHRVNEEVFSRIGNKGKVYLQSEKAIGYNKAIEDAINLIGKIKL